MSSGLYIHLPFCIKKCDYCSFYSIPIGEKKDIVSVYIENLKKDFSDKITRYNITDFDTIFFGGGTPSILDPLQVEEIIQHIKNSSNISSHAEISLEMNPDTLSSEKLTGYTSAGVNRIVLGVQTFNKRHHDFIGRASEIAGRKEMDIFFDNKNFIHSVDLIAGIPGQSILDLEEDIDLLTEYQPEHISAYLLSIEENTPLCKRVNMDDSFKNSQRNLFEKMISSFKEKGYIHYEISNYALPGFESKHNLKYWGFLPYLGIGPGAHSFINNKRFMNRSSVKDYNNGIFHEDIDERGDNSLVVEYIMTGMRLMKGISKNKFEERLELLFPEKIFNSAEKLRDEGLVKILNKGADINISLTTEGIFLSDHVIYKMVESFL